MGITTSFSRGKPPRSSREVGDGLTDADVAIDPALREPIEPEVPSRRMFGHANARDDGLDAGPAGGESAEEIGMKQKRLDNLRILGGQQPLQSMGDRGKLPDPATAEAMDLDAGRLERRQAGRFLPLRPGRQAVDDRREAAAVDAGRRSPSGTVRPRRCPGR